MKEKNEKIHLHNSYTRTLSSTWKLFHIKTKITLPVFWIFVYEKCYFFLLFAPPYTINDKMNEQLQIPLSFTFCEPSGFEYYLQCSFIYGYCSPTLSRCRKKARNKNHNRTGWIIMVGQPIFFLRVIR